MQLQDSKKYGVETRLECVRKYILLGKSDRAIHLLLESDSESSSFYSDSLRSADVYDAAILIYRLYYCIHLYHFFQCMSAGHRQIIWYIPEHSKISSYKPYSPWKACR